MSRRRVHYAKKRRVLHPPVYVGVVPALLYWFELHEEFLCAGCGKPSKTVAAVLPWPLAGPKARFFVCPSCKHVPADVSERHARAARITEALLSARPASLPRSA